MKKFLVSLFCCAVFSMNAATVVFSSHSKRETNYVEIGSTKIFTADKMALNDVDQTIMTLSGSYDEQIEFGGNWQFNKNYATNKPKEDWAPLTDISPLKMPRHPKPFQIRCTTKPPNELTIKASSIK